MISNFSAKLVAVASMAVFAKAQIPRQCFFVERMHGPPVQEGDLLSNLPALEDFFKPGMRIESITGFSDMEDDERITGLKMDLISPRKERLSLPSMGVKADDWELTELKFKSDNQPDRIAILEDELGICDVVIYQDHVITSLSKDTMDCMVELKGITETVLRLPEETPLVGFHSMSDYDGMMSLGVILYDATEPGCQISKLGEYDEDQDPDADEFEESAYAESKITQEEKNRATALEAILQYNSLKRNRESTEDVLKKIKELHNLKPIDFEGQGIERENLVELMERLAYLDDMDKPDIKDLKVMFEQLSQHYMDVYDDDDERFVDQRLPITIGDLKVVYQHLAARDGGISTEFWGKKDVEPATTVELSILFDKMAEHYDSTSYSTHIDVKDNMALVDIFDRMGEYYAFDEGQRFPDADELSIIYDELAEAYGKESDFTVITNGESHNDARIDEILKLLKNGDKIQESFELDIIDDMNDLLEMQDEGEQDQMNAALDDLIKFEHQTKQGEEWFGTQFDEIEAEMDELFETVSHEDDRLIQMQKLIKDGQINAKKQSEFEQNALKNLNNEINAMDQREYAANQLKDNSGKINTVDHSELDPNALKNGEINPVDQSTLNPNALKDNSSGFGPSGNINAIDQDTLKPNALTIMTTQEQEREEEVEREVDQKLEMAAEKMIYTFLGVLFVAVLVGTAIGAMCIMCVMKCCNSSQKKRLADVQKSGEYEFRQGNTDTMGESARQNNFRNQLAVPMAATDTLDLSPRGGESPATGTNMIKIKSMATEEFDTMEARDVIDDSEENQEMGQVISSKGLTYNPGNNRRATYTAAKNPGQNNNVSPLKFGRNGSTKQQLNKIGGSKRELDLGVKKMEMD